MSLEQRRQFLYRPLAYIAAAKTLGNTLPAQAMWQQWTPSDMLYYVESAQPGNITSVLESMDKAASTSWMMNMGPEKAAIMRNIISDLKPQRVLEIGTFLGYMTMTMAQEMSTGSKLVTIEKDSVNHAAASKILNKAMGDLSSYRVPVDSWLGASGDVLESKEFKRAYRGQPFDLILMDHWKAEYTQDLNRLEKLGFVGKGSIVIADNVVFPGAPEYLNYLGIPFQPTQDEVSGQECLAPSIDAGKGAVYLSHGWKSNLIPVPFEYRPLTPDALSFSIRVQ
jgi:catechol O-methyltransferase